MSIEAEELSFFHVDGYGRQGQRRQGENDVNESLTNQKDNTVVLAGIFDQRDHTWGPWGRDVMNVTVQLLNEPNNGFHDEIAASGMYIDWKLGESSDCNEALGIKSYLDLTYQQEQQEQSTDDDAESKSTIIHGIVGCRCSDATFSVATVAEIENIPIVSPSSTSEHLSDETTFAHVSRLVSPDNADGQVGALVATINLFGWEHVTVVATDTQYGRDLATSFQQHFESGHVGKGNGDGTTTATTSWNGKVRHTALIPLNFNGTLNDEYVTRVLRDIPDKDDESKNSRIILLAAHDHHAYGILKKANEMNFQPDTIWIGPQAWIGRLPRNKHNNNENDDGTNKDVATSWMPDLPGYIGVTPFRNRNIDYQHFLQRLQDWQRRQGLEEEEVWEDLPDYAAETMVDSIVSLAKALSQTPLSQRKNGTYVSEVISTLNFHGVSGHVSFTEHGDRDDPQFTIFNLRRRGTSYEWITIGTSDTDAATFGERWYPCGLLPRSIWVWSRNCTIRHIRGGDPRMENRLSIFGCRLSIFGCSRGDIGLQMYHERKEKKRRQEKTYRSDGKVYEGKEGNSRVCGIRL